MSIYRAVSSAIFWFRSSSSCHVSLTPCCDRGKPTSIDPYSKGEARGFVFSLVSVWFFVFMLVSAVLFFVFMLVSAV